nr:hemolysin III family protein [Lachnospiraceae bacterium]
MQITLREPGSAITHFVAMTMAIGGSVPLLIKAAEYSTVCLVAMLIFILSMILLYGASATYHSVNVPAAIIKIYRKVDHAMIFVLIAGSYTPVCLLVLEPSKGYPLLIAVWSFAIVGIAVKLLWINCPKWFSSIIYIAMGWLCAFVFTPILSSLTRVAFYWLLAGGLIYTVGGIIYALKLQIFNAKHKYFGSHEIFHLFVMAGSLCHYIFMYQYVIGM